MSRNNAKTGYLIKILFLFIILSFILTEIKNFISKNNYADYAIKISDLKYSLKNYNTTTSQSIVEMERRTRKKLTYIELLQLEKDILNIIIRNTLILAEANNNNKSQDQRIIIQEFKRLKVIFKKNNIDKKYFYKMLNKYKLSEKDFIVRIKDKIIRSLFVNSILLNNLLVMGLKEMMIKHDFQVRTFETIYIQINDVNIINKNTDKELKNTYKSNKFRFNNLEKRKVQYIILSTQMLKKSITGILNSKIKDNYNSKRFYFLEKNKINILFIDCFCSHNNNAILENLYKDKVIKKHKKKILVAQNLNILELIVKKKTIIEDPLGMYIIKIKKEKEEKLKNNDLIKVIRELYIKQILINELRNKISKIKTEITKNKDIKYLAKNNKIKIKSATLSYNLKNYNEFIKTKRFVGAAFNTNVEAQSSIFEISSNKFCILKVKRVLYENKIKNKDIKVIIKVIWKRKNISLRILKNNVFSSKNIFIPQNYSNMRKINVKNRKNISYNSYKLMFKLKNKKCYFPIFVDKNNRLYLVKIQKIIIPREKKMAKYSRIYQKQIKFIERNIVMQDIINISHKKNSLYINPVIKNYIYKKLQ